MSYVMFHPKKDRPAITWEKKGWKYLHGVRISGWVNGRHLSIFCKKARFIGPVPEQGAILPMAIYQDRVDHESFEIEFEEEESDDLPTVQGRPA